MGQDVGFYLAIGLALAFALTTGLNDAANAIATLVATRIAAPLPAVLLAAVFNMLGPLFLGAAVADTIGHIVIVPPERVVAVLGAGLTGAVVWNLGTWWRGIPSSSSHALVGGLVGAAALDSGVSAVAWGPFGASGHLVGFFGVLIGLFVATVLGFAVALTLERFALWALRRATHELGTVVRGLQWITTAWLAFSHGSNDAQKSVGVVAALLLATGRTNSLAAPIWVAFVVALVLTLGTALGGWSIVRTIGRRIFPLRSVDGLVSQTSAAGVIIGATLAGVPVSTSQVVSSSIVGIGVGRRRWRHVGWEVVREIGVAWVTTIPASAIIAGLALPGWRLITGI